MKFGLSKSTLSCLLIIVAIFSSLPFASAQELRSNVYVKFITLPTSDNPIGVIRIYEDASNEGFDCKDCSEDYKFNARRVSLLIDGQPAKLKADDYGVIENQVASVYIEKSGIVSQISFQNFMQDVPPLSAFD